MNVIKGKHNIARIYADALDAATREQILFFVNHPALAGRAISVMPDCHSGKGACVGFTMPLNDYIIPNIIGVDIGCGMLATCYGKVSPEPSAIDWAIKRNIPAGMTINNEISCPISLREEVLEACEYLGIEADKALRAVGSLGGGNHFIEFDKDENDNVWSIIHSGSRNFGLQIANFFHKKAEKLMSEFFVEPENGLAFMPLHHPCAKKYLEYMKVAQLFASANRYEMEKRIRQKLGLSICDQIESVHNFIGEDNIIRKGATSAKENERCVIPFNSVDGTAICVGKGNADWNYSAPHGAGRLMSRTKAKESLSLEKMRKLFEGRNIYTTTANMNTLDESPEAYKPVGDILEQIKDSVDVVSMLKPFYNFKAS